jgi:Ca2+-binding EF-hand superfamily protein
MKKTSAKVQRNVMKGMASLRERLAEDPEKLEVVFGQKASTGRASGAGTKIDLVAFREMIPDLGIVASKNESKVLFEMCDTDGSGEIELEELQAIISDNTIPTTAEIEAAQSASVAVVNKHASLREQLKKYSVLQGYGEEGLEEALAAVFRTWDVDESGGITIDEFEEQLLPRIGLKASRKETQALFKLCDKDGNGTVELHELQETLLRPLATSIDPLPVRVLNTVLAFFNATSVQTILYLAFVAVFQSLTTSLREKEEYFFDKFISDTLIENHFDSSHNTFESVRRVADIYEWGNVVLWPGLFGNAGPHCANVGLSGGFNSWSSAAAGPTAQRGGAPYNQTSDIGWILGRKACNEDGWPDGEGVFHGEAPTAWTVGELLQRYNAFDWSEGISIRQNRVKGSPGNEDLDTPEGCGTELLGANAVCLTELNGEVGVQDQEPFGFNWTHPGSPLDHPFLYRDAEWLGSNPMGQASAAPASLRLTPPGGFTVVIMPFFSDAFLPEQRGTYTEVTGFQEHRVKVDNVPGEGNGRIARYYCVRFSWNTVQIHQVCDPNDALNRTTGVVRAAVEEFWNDLKRAT